MSANVETMFYARETPWHGLGVRVESALSSAEAIEKAGLNWDVNQHPVKTDDGIDIPGYKANIRSSDNKILGVVTDRYKVVQNSEAFAFTDGLLGEGVTYETAGSLSDGKKIWLLAKLPEKYTIIGENVEPYLVFSNSHDGNGAIRVAMTPVRVVCQNTLNLALSTAQRTWSMVHVGDLAAKMDEARSTLELADKYMNRLGTEFERLNRIQISDGKVMEYIEMLIPVEDDANDYRKKNIERLREDLKIRYFNAPDLHHVPKGGYRFICAVSDFATHSTPLRESKRHKENMFAKTIVGNPLIDKAYEMALETV